MVKEFDEVIEPAKVLSAPLIPDLPPTDEKGSKFRPLTEEEKKDFMNSLDAEGRQIAVMLTNASPDWAPSRKIGT